MGENWPVYLGGLLLSGTVMYQSLSWGDPIFYFVMASAFIFSLIGILDEEHLEIAEAR